jgi:hypothetical protein
VKLIDPEKMTREQLDRHIWNDHRNSGPRQEQGRRAPDKWQTLNHHRLLHADELAEGVTPHTHDAVKTTTAPIVRIIKATPGLRHGYWSASGRVAGWGTWHEGLRAESKTDGSVHLDYIAGHWASQSSEEEQYKLVTEVLTAKGYTVTAESSVASDYTKRVERWLVVRKG